MFDGSIAPGRTQGVGAEKAGAGSRRMAHGVSDAVHSSPNRNVLRLGGLSLNLANRSFRIPSTTQSLTIQRLVKLQQKPTDA
jgi:hypothetical protein